jgi:hypothetical protein
MKHLILNSLMAVCFISTAASVAAQSNTTRVYTPFGGYERSASHERLEIAIPPVVRHEIHSSYNRGRTQNDAAYQRTLSVLRENRPVTNSSEQVRTTTTTRSVGFGVAGYGIERSASRTSARSSQEDANHMWERTNHLRLLEGNNQQRGRQR